MRIAIDARELAGQPTGVGRFLGEILREWTQMPEADEHEFVYCAPAELVMHAGSKDPAYGTSEIVGKPELPPSREASADRRSRAGGGQFRQGQEEVFRRPELQFRQGQEEVFRRPEHQFRQGQGEVFRRPELQFRQGRVEIEPGDGTLWEQRTLPRLARRAQANVLFCPGYSGPMFGDVPLVVAIHDVSFAAHPEWFRWREGLRRRLVTRWAAQRAERVITISEFSRGEIVEHLGVPASKIDVIYPGVSCLGAVRNAAPPHIVARAAHPLVIYVGSIFNRRHVPETIRGFARLTRRHPDVRFTLVGDNRTFPHLRLEQVIDDSGQGERIAFRSYVSDAELAELYQHARALVFLSEYEGFGLTPLEALASGIPVVVLDTPVAREVYGPAAIYVAAPEPRLIAAALEQALFDEPTRAGVLAAAPAVLGRYSWRECARSVLKVLVRAGQ